MSIDQELGDETGFGQDAAVVFKGGDETAGVDG